jgi:hypothetical protein
MQLNGLDIFFELGWSQNEEQLNMTIFWVFCREFSPEFSSLCQMRLGHLAMAFLWWKFGVVSEMTILGL